MKFVREYVTIELEVIWVSFSILVERELRQQEKLMLTSQQVLRNAPEGFLKMRRRKSGTTFYQCHKTCDGWIEENISADPERVRTLLDKRVQKEVGRRTVKNIELLSEMRSSYQDTENQAILQSLSPAYQDAYRSFSQRELHDWANTPYPKCEYEPQHLVHETLSGIFVRSKSEVIIANTLTYYHIPFRYEELMIFPGQPDRYFYPDFRIRLPLRGYKVWEHLGILNKKTYCESTAKKLYTY